MAKGNSISSALGLGVTQYVWEGQLLKTPGDKDEMLVSPTRSEQVTTRGSIHV